MSRKKKNTLPRQYRNAPVYKTRVKPLPIILISVLAVVVLGVLGFFGVRAFASSSHSQSTEEFDALLAKNAAEKKVGPFASEVSFEETVIAVGTPSPPRTNSGQKGLPILMYHAFYDDTAGEAAPNDNYMAISDFREQMKYLAEQGYYYPTWQEVADFATKGSPIPDKSVVVTDDDGDESFFRLALPVINEYRVGVTSFLITSRTGKDTIEANKSKFVNYQSHSHDMHRAGSDGKGRFTTLSHDEAATDLDTTISILGSHEAFCYPFGHYNEFTKSMLKEKGYLAAVTTESGRVTPGDDPFALPRVRMSKGVSLSSFISKVE